MFRKAATLFVLFLALCFGAYAQPEAVREAHAATHSILMATIVEHAGCSATAVSRHALITATHCELGADEVLIDIHNPAHILAKLRDGNDHTIFITDATFDHYTSLSDRELEQGDTVFAFGNPGGLRDIFRFGTFSGFIHPGFFAAPVDRLIFDFNVFHGDSGAALFDAVSGKIVTVITGSLTLGSDNDQTRFTYAYPLAFTKEQLKQLK